MTERVGLAAADFVIKQDSTLPEIRATLLDANDDPIDLTDATVRFHMKDTHGDIIVDAPATILAPLLGRVEYAWVAADTAEAGWMAIEWEITIDVTLDVTIVPSLGYDKVHITAKIA